MVGRSCHTEYDLGRLSTEDYVTVSPVFATASKPGYGPPLRADGLARLCRTPGVFALGGVTSPAQAQACLAAGVAVMGAVMRVGDPGRVITDLLCALDRGRLTGADAAARQSA
ncbi:MAG TPA: thiamine phosphate synthase [Micromonosporaceae bacterium]|jgi:thiamine-phosphate pyrophosphorylase|nr:thiamine phosphate synthase [Micromonosporaceae bacterium]